MWHALRFDALGLLLCLLLEEVVENRSEVFEVIVGYRKATRSAYLVHVDNNDRSRTRDAIDIVLSDEVFKPRSAVLMHSPLPPQPQNPRRTIESVEHDRDAVVAGFVEMCNRFVAAAGKLLIPEGLLVQHTKVLAALGRHVNVPFAG